MTSIPYAQPYTQYMKRVGGLPGEHIRIDPPHLIVNGKAVTLSGEVRLADRGSPYQAALTHTTNGLTLGPDEYFVIGDNTSASLDSRYWGPLPKDNIVGRATRVYWPFNKLRILDPPSSKPQHEPGLESEPPAQ